jgi:hypothetical protein
VSLTVRPAQPADLPRCLEILHGRYAITGTDEQSVLAYWTYLIESRAGVCLVVTDLSPCEAPRILVFAAGIFVSDDVVRGALTTLPPHLGLQAARAWSSGRRMHLSRREIAQENARDGLNSVIIGYGTAPNLSPDVDRQARARMATAGVLMSLVGYRIKCSLQEGFGTEFHEDFVTTGRKVVRSFPVAAPVVPCRRDGPPTHLYGVSRDDRPEGALWWMFFNPPEPRLGLSAGEKDTLELALESATDEEIAGRLHVSIWTVKKRWQKIYARVEQVIPGLLFPAQQMGGSTPGQPSERRRHLLAYLRQHLEEIRPRASTDERSDAEPASPAV